MRHGRTWCAFDIYYVSSLTRGTFAMNRTKKEIEEKLEEVTSKLRGDDTRGPFFYWLGFRRALEWILGR